MCGITAIFGGRPDAEQRVGQMMQALAHRGPDGQGIKILKNACLGHVRLSIIDLDTGGQPLSEPQQRYWIIFNGEIYNFHEIREELEAKGRQFTTRSDTEVVLLSYVEWGAACLERFRGMFAFAIWDDVEEKLFAARDLFGEKPFYFAECRPGQLVVASEPKAMLASGLVGREVDLDSVDAYLALGYVPPERSIFREISVLPPAHFLEWGKGILNVSKYWRPVMPERRLSLDAAADELGDLLACAVKRQMVADVPVGAFLSGGLDSSTIVAMMAEHTAHKIKTFSAGFGNHINELPYARAVAGKYGTEHYELDFGEPDVARLLEEMAGVYDEPFSDSSNIPTYLIARFAREKVKVVLSGDGGDELLGGYWWHRLLAQSEEIPPSMLKWLVLRLGSKLLRDRHTSLARYTVALGWKSRYADVYERAIAAQIAIPAGERKRLWAGRQSGRAFPPVGDYYRPERQEEGLNRGFHFDLTCYLSGDILVKVDRAAMANSLETRAPFLDRDFAQFSLSLPASLKVSADESKIVLHKACSDYWPDELRGRPKQGFGAPYTVWLKRPDVQKLCERVFSAGGSLRKLLPGLSAGQAKQNTYRTWVLLCLGLWLERWAVDING